MKKGILFFAAVSAVMIMLVPSAVAQEFDDLSSTHWAYTAVQELVREGTVNGDESGRFHPNGEVTRAEFVKMIGMGTAHIMYRDIEPSHWGYDYIVSSGITPDADGNFSPSAMVTRGELIEILWKRAGSPQGAIVPQMITEQAKQEEAAAWAYENGIITGENGIDLRLDAYVSRAEAAAMILRSRQMSKTDFVQILSEEMLEKVYYGSALTSKTNVYDGSKTLTNGEIAKMAVCLASDKYDPNYSKFDVTNAFDGAYGKDITALSAVLGDNATAEFAQKPAVKKDAIVMLVYGAVKKTPTSYGNKDNYYQDITGELSPLENTMLTWAYETGIQLYHGGTLNGADRPITQKEVAAILLQLDSVLPLAESVDTNGSRSGMKLQHDTNKYPDNWRSFACILADLPKQVYETPFHYTNETSAVSEKAYDMGRGFSDLFILVLNDYQKRIEKESGIQVQFTFYPSLVHDNKMGYVYRVKCEIINGGDETKTYQDVFQEKNDTLLTTGLVFYADAMSDYAFGMGVGAQFAFSDAVYIQP